MINYNIDITFDCIIFYDLLPRVILIVKRDKCMPR